MKYPPILYFFTGILLLVTLTACPDMGNSVPGNGSGTTPGHTSNLVSMVSVPGGSYSNEYATITVSGFWMGISEVTQDLYTEVMGTNPSRFTGDDQRPVEQLSWYDCLVFCNTLSLREGLTPVYTIDGSTDPSDWGTVPTNNNDLWNAVIMDIAANGYRLPTEAEWEFAARGGDPADSYKYAGGNDIDELAWYSGNSESTTKPVMGKNPNKLGLYDMSGNVYEWCWDRYGNLETGMHLDPLGPSSGTNRVSHGGSWGYPASDSTVWKRQTNVTHLKSHQLGFRLARSNTASPTPTAPDPQTHTMVSVPIGSFHNGTSTVHLSAFLMSTTEISQAQYEHVMGSFPYPMSVKGASHPVYAVSWYDALVFCNKLSILENRTPVYRINGDTNPDSWGAVPSSYNASWSAVTMDRSANGYRLPTEAEWEYAARGGFPADSYTYAGGNDIEHVGWTTTSKESRAVIRPVGGREPNKLGLYDMSGNVAEWCWDIHGEYPDVSQTNPEGATSGTLRVYRGGSAGGLDSWAEVSHREKYDPSNRAWVQNGFRIVCSVGDAGGDSGAGEDTDGDTDENGTVDLPDEEPSQEQEPGTGEESGSSLPIVISLSPAIITSNDPFIVSCTGLPGNPNDWIAILEEDAPDNAYMQWYYITGAPNEVFTFEAIPAGNYEVRVFYNNGYTMLARQAFTVYAGVETPSVLSPPSWLDVGSPTSSTLTISWSAVTDALGYCVYRSTSSSGIYSIVGTVYDGTSFTDIGLSADTTFWYRVSVYNMYAVESEQSTAYSGRTASAPLPPQNGSIEIQLDDGSLYTVRYSPTNNAPSINVGDTSTSYTVFLNSHAPNSISSFYTVAVTYNRQNNRSTPIDLYTIALYMYEDTVLTRSLIFGATSLGNDPSVLSVPSISGGTLSISKIFDNPVSPMSASGSNTAVKLVSVIVENVEFD